MEQLIIAIALWCGQIYFPPQYNSVTTNFIHTKSKIDQCRVKLLNCINDTDTTPHYKDRLNKCFKDMKLDE